MIRTIPPLDVPPRRPQNISPGYCYINVKELANPVTTLILTITLTLNKYHLQVFRV